MIIPNIIGILQNIFRRSFEQREMRRYKPTQLVAVKRIQTGFCEVDRIDRLFCIEGGASILITLRCSTVLCWSSCLGWILWDICYSSHCLPLHLEYYTRSIFESNRIQIILEIKFNSREALFFIYKESFYSFNNNLSLKEKNSLKIIYAFH